MRYISFCFILDKYDVNKYNNMDIDKVLEEAFMTKHKLVMFDLDGTLSESAQGIRECIILTLNEMGLPVPELDDYSKYIGPPLYVTFQRLCGLTGEQARKGAEIYVKHYIKKGIYMNKAYTGLRELITSLASAGKKTAVATSKNEELAKDVLKHIGLYDCFDFICGSGLDGTRKEKHDVIEYVMKKTGFDGAQSVMIGDTRFDAEGAKIAGCDFIGVLYGYGVKSEMERYGAKAFAGSVSELSEILL